MHEVEFHEPVFVGDLVEFLHGNGARRPDVGDRARRGRGRAMGQRASESGPIRRGERVKVTEAEVILVAVDELGRPIPIRPEIPTA